MYVHGMLFSIQMWPPNWQVASIVLLSVIIFNVGFLYLGLVSRDCPVYEAYQREKGECSPVQRRSISVLLVFFDYVMEIRGYFARFR